VIPQRALTPESLALRLETVLNNPAILVKAAAQAKTQARVDAAQKLADVVCTIINYSRERQEDDYNGGGSDHSAAA
jgi:UDP-N-acetylglucosamine--N-acetylmuramyl-(pentapeptide) pyrophosphoryl-undecaprenol N-acetylglucosamine transferase